MDNLSNPFVSVVIPVFNNPEGLKICLAALENQTYPKSLYEVIVVDNGSNESRPGSYAARNKGISLAKGEIIALTDSDCVPASNWIEKGVANLLRVPGCGLVAGKVEMTFKNPNKPTAVEIFDATNFDQKRLVEKCNYGITANIFTFKSVIEYVGYFDDNLKSCGDYDWGMRVFTAGYKQIYGDDTCVSHPARSSYSQLYKRYARVAGGDYDVKKKSGYSSIEFIMDAARNLKPPIKDIFRILLGRKVWYSADLKFTSSIQKLNFIFVILLVRYVSGWEKILLLLGSKPKRI